MFPPSQFSPPRDPVEPGLTISSRQGPGEAPALEDVLGVSIALCWASLQQQSHGGVSGIGPNFPFVRVLTTGAYENRSFIKSTGDQQALCPQNSQLDI